MKHLLLALGLFLLLALPAQAAPRHTWQWTNAIKLQNGTQYLAPNATHRIAWIYDGTIDFYQPQTQASVNAVVSTIPRQLPTALAFHANTHLESFQDAQWTTFLTNMGYLSNAAKRYGFMGVLWDDEPYTLKHVYRYSTPAQAKAAGKAYAQVMDDSLLLGSYTPLGMMGIEPGHRGVYDKSYPAFWKEVRKHQKKVKIFYEDQYVYRDYRFGWFNNFIKQQTNASWCVGLDQAHLYPQLGCRWLYLED